MNAKAKTLLATARENPWWQFDADDISEIMNLSANTIAMLKRAKESPFIAGKTRPERIEKFFEKHPGWKPTLEE